MDFTLRIPNDLPQRQALEQAISRLLTYVDAGSVYVSRGHENGPPVMVTFILKKNCGQSGDAVARMSQKVTRDYSEFAFHFFNATVASQEFNEGRPYFYRHCTSLELVYHEPGNKVYYPAFFNAKKVIRKAFEYTGDKSIAKDYVIKADVYINMDDHLAAANHLHSALWYLYSCVCEMTLPEGEGSKSLMKQYGRAVGVAPSLKAILDIQNPEDNEIFTMLVTADSCSRGNYSMAAIPVSLLERAKSKIRSINWEAGKIIKNYSKTIKAKADDMNNQLFLGKAFASGNLQFNYIMAQVLAEISGIIAGLLPTRAIYCFGYTTCPINEEAKRSGFTKDFPGYHFYVLVHSRENREDITALIQAAVRDRFEGKHRVTILIHRLKNLRKQSHNQMYFFESVVNRGLLVYNDPQLPVNFIPEGSTKDHDHSKTFWMNRIMAATQLMDSATELTTNDQALLKNTLLHQATEQIALGIIELFLGYHPATHSLACLLSLVAFTQEIEIPFGNTTEQEQRLYKLLTAHIGALRHQDLKLYDIADSNVLFGQCQAFLEDAKRIGSTVIKHLESTNIQLTQLS
ncbi:hypothetical protein FNO01nite_34710 [Flavobacterium noncentrifugens]|uniref:HEPN domain-containing protein n=1 Tax=Flavobacterium noncentrifugens TaxID=1128970 RepID=A0A1G8UTU4_9FLAO|nr:hypothetical protein [Flavobacterium noncentrifugens]GEP52799.1 hypothetical protein FNO01nite_34710 [Flavobacterium noncentrifugens]SDJ57223.1 hypothetical protein SAMN04487935_1044 [Flavobacterium noncentrifugens]